MELGHAHTGALALLQPARGHGACCLPRCRRHGSPRCGESPQNMTLFSIRPAIAISMEPDMSRRVFHQTFWILRSFVHLDEVEPVVAALQQGQNAVTDLSAALRELDVPHLGIYTPLALKHLRLAGESCECTGDFVVLEPLRLRSKCRC